MVRLRQGVDILKREYEGVLARPNRAFLVVFASLMVLGPGLATLLIHPLSSSAWFASAVGFSSIAGFVACTVGLRRQAPWLSWSLCGGILCQVVAAGLILWLPIAYQFGWLGKSAPSNLTGLWIFILWAALALVSAWGMIRNRWWGFFGEVVVLCAAVAAIVYFPVSTGKSTHRPNLIPWSNEMKALANLGVFVFINWSLIQKGIERWNATRVQLSEAG